MDHHHRLILLITLISSLILLSLAAATLAYLKLYRRYRIPLCADCRSDSDDLELGPAQARVADGPEIKPDKEPEPAELAARQFEWSELEKLTDGFAENVIVGEGGFSTVYFARLNGGEEAAVKLHRSSERLHRAFRQELDVLLGLLHPHIVRLLGYCDDREEGVLVFEFIPNGSLHEKLHGSSTAVLPWQHRMVIAHQLALALEYLHDSCDPQIIHGDIKSANVLLDEDLNSKLIDFGFARKGFSAAIGLGRSTMFGSPGYVDPHYIRSGLVSKKSDVYSYGVLLLEIITGLEAFISESEQRLTTAVGPRLSGIEGRAMVEELVDSKLGGNYDVEEAKAVLKVVEMCIGDNPGLRPPMGEVARIVGEKARESILAVGGRSDGGK